MPQLILLYVDDPSTQNSVTNQREPTQLNNGVTGNRTMASMMARYEAESLISRSISPAAVRSTIRLENDMDEDGPGVVIERR